MAGEGRGTKMVYGKTDSYECPDCLSKQDARVLELAPGGNRVKRLQCLTCDTEWNPTIPLSMQRAADFDMGDDGAPDQGKQNDHDPDHTRGGQDPE